MLGLEGLLDLVGGQAGVGQRLGLWAGGPRLLDDGLGPLVEVAVVERLVGVDDGQVDVAVVELLARAPAGVGERP